MEDKQRTDKKIPENRGFKDVPERRVTEAEAKNVRGGAGPIDGKRSPTVLPASPIDSKK